MRKYKEKIMNNGGLSLQSIVNQFYGEQDRYNVNIEQRTFFRNNATLGGNYC
jgi:hypothetical protein